MVCSCVVTCVYWQISRRRCVVSGDAAVSSAVLVANEDEIALVGLMLSIVVMILMLMCT